MGHKTFNSGGGQSAVSDGSPAPVDPPVPIWYRDPAILFTSPLDFLPVGNRNIVLQLNAFVRLGFYLAIIMALIRQLPAFLFVAVLFMVIALVAQFVMGGVPRDKKKREGFLGIVGLPPAVETEGTRAPTVENPFMNLLAGEIAVAPVDPVAYSEDIDTDPHAMRAYVQDTASPLEAAQAKAVRDQLSTTFMDRLWSDPADAFNRMQSQREYITMPNTATPSDQEAYIRFRFSGMSTPICKEGFGARCGLDRAAQGLVAQT